MGQIIRRHLYGYLVTGQDLDKVHTELAGNVCQNGVSIADIYLNIAFGSASVTMPSISITSSFAKLLTSQVIALQVLAQISQISS